MYEDRGITYIETIDAITDPLYLGSPYDPWVKGAPESVCPAGTVYLGEDEFGNPECGVQTPDYNPGGQQLICEDGTPAVTLANGDQVCGGVTGVAPTPIGTVQNPFPTTTPTPTTGGGIIDLLPDGIIGDDGTIFGFSPLVAIGGVAVAAYLLISGSKK